jgi:RNA polymerase sigma-70 factor (ECF subfamily)
MVSTPGPVRPWEEFRSYLRLLAQIQLSPIFQGKLDASDVAQETLLKAHERQDQFRGSTDVEQAAWLRQILANKLIDLARQFGADGRDLQREQALEEALRDSSARLEAVLATDSPSPGEKCVSQEDLLRLSWALVQLPEDQRTAVTLKHLEGQTVEAIAQHMGRGRTAIGGLLRRGMSRLRELLREDSGNDE